MARRRTIRNDRGIRIVCICASCKHSPRGKVIDPDCEFRTCELDQKDKKPVKPLDTCLQWEPKEQYMQVGTKDPGQVKCKEYIQLVSEIRIKENKNKVPKDEELKTADIREMFLAKSNSLYIDM